MSSPTTQQNTLLPFYNADSEILILGSFPSVKSREMGFYYGHPQNRFWKVLAGIFNEETPEHSNIEAKKSFLTRHKIALWDVASACQIIGSDDSSMKNVIPNNIPQFIEENHLPIRKILINGGKAQKLFEKQNYTLEIEVANCPSTSPANAHFTLEKLTEIWKEAIEK